MIECIFTIDYEIYGNGEGSMRELIYEPTRELMAIFKEWDATFVVFAEALEFKKIQEHRTDERNLCSAPEERVEEVVVSAIEYLRGAIKSPAYNPVSFRGGLWLMQPSGTMARVLSRHGMRIDSSVFKGGRIRDVELDYRPALANGYYWQFAEDVNVADPQGALWELPIHTEMVPFWKMIRGKRLGLHRKMPTSKNGGPLKSRFSDFARFTYPRKFDFCRMNLEEMKSVVDAVLHEDEKTPETYKPVVAIGHSKDLVDFEAIRRFLGYLADRGVGLSDFPGALRRVQSMNVTNLK
jgi:hypothetical protein